MKHPTKEEIKEEMQSYNADEVGLKNPITMEEAEYNLLNSDKYHYADEDEEQDKADKAIMSDLDYANSRENKTNEVCTHEDKCIYHELGQMDGKPCYICECGDCKKHFIIWLDEGENEDFESEEHYKDFKKNLI